MSRGKVPKKPEAARPRRVPVVVMLDAAQEVVLTGDFTGWALDRVRLEKGEGNQWRTELVLAPGEYQYRAPGRRGLAGRSGLHTAHPQRLRNPEQRPGRRMRMSAPPDEHKLISDSPSLHSARLS